MHETELQQIGLSEKEAKVYVATLGLGKATAQEVAKKSGLKRPTTYFTIEGLMKKGLMSSVYEGKKQYFMAENPERLTDVFERKQDEVRRQGEKLKKLIPDLKRLAPGKTGGPAVKYYVGKEGAISMVKELMDFKGNNVWVAYPHDTVAQVFSTGELDQMRFTRNKEDVRVKCLYTSETTELQDNPATERIRLKSEECPLPADIAVYGNVVRLSSFRGGVVGIVVEDEDIAVTMRTLFNLAWKAAKQ